MNTTADTGAALFRVVEKNAPSTAENFLLVKSKQMCRFWRTSCQLQILRQRSYERGDHYYFIRSMSFNLPDSPWTQTAVQFPH